jgi:hypothetical protein
MNWDTTKFGDLDVQAALNDGMSDMCEHVKAAPVIAYAVLGEQDSFGPVAQTVVCEMCFDAHQKAEEERKVRCKDCGKELPA